MILSKLDNSAEGSDTVINITRSFLYNSSIGNSKKEG